MNPRSFSDPPARGEFLNASTWSAETAINLTVGTGLSGNAFQLLTNTAE
jgi:hypothetical protein